MHGTRSMVVDVLMVMLLPGLPGGGARRMAICRGMISNMTVCTVCVHRIMIRLVQLKTGWHVGCV
jgi:hypothetical protein